MIERDPKAIEYVLREARENDVKFVRLWFTDILGNLKGFASTVEELESSLTRGMGFDGSTIEGFARTDERDLYALPDPNTFNILPWRPRTNAVARMFCDIITPGEEYFEGDSRYVLKRNLERAAALGFTYYVAPEIEHFYFKDSHGTEPLDQGDCCDERRCSRWRSWVSPSSPAITRSPPASTRSTSAIPMRSPWPIP